MTLVAQGLIFHNPFHVIRRCRIFIESLFVFIANRLQLNIMMATSCAICWHSVQVYIIYKNSYIDYISG